MDDQERIRRLTALSMPTPLAQEVVKQTTPATIDAPEGVCRVIYILEGADLASMEPQQFTQIGDFEYAIPRDVFATNASATPTSATGGIFPDAAKALPGTTTATQSFASMNSNSRILTVSISANQQALVSPPFLIMATAATVPSTCDIYITGYVKK